MAADIDIWDTTSVLSGVLMVTDEGHAPSC
jgi:hypothetical protein